MAESGIDTFFCQYCGTKILLQNETNLKTRFGMKKLEHAEKMADKVFGYFDRRRKQKAIEEEKKRKEVPAATLSAGTSLRSTCLRSCFIRFWNWLIRLFKTL
jgi:hypothetical protein